MRPLTAASQGRGPRAGRSVALSLGLAAALLALVVGASGMTLAELGSAVRRVPPGLILAVAGAQGAIVALAAVKWRLILRANGGQGLPIADALGATTLGTLAGQVMPIQLVTPALRAWIARPHGIPAARAIGTSLLEQVFEIVVLGAMAAAGLVAQAAGLSLMQGGALALIIAAAMTIFVAPGLRLAQRATGVFAARFGGPFARLAEGFARAGRLPHRLMFQLTGLSLLRYALLAGLNVALLVQLAPQADPLVLLAAFPLVQLLTALPIVPAGLGLVEMTWSGVLITQGLGPAEVAGAALALRLVSTAGFLVFVPVLVAPMLVGLGRRAGAAR